MTKNNLILYLLVGNFLFPTNLFSFDKEDQNSYQTEAMIWEQVGIERAGDQLVERGLYDDAIAKYREALAPRLIKREEDKCQPLARIQQVHRLQGRYEEALTEMDWFIRQNPKKQEYVNDELELEALIRARDIKSPQPIYDHIQYLRKKYASEIPPKVGGYSSIIASKLIYLYDHVGDYDAGIDLMDGFIRYYAKKAHIRPEQMGSKNQYLQVKQAFEQDKKEGFKGCLEAKPGDACMGHATQALIQSDYFPW